MRIKLSRPKGLSGIPQAEVAVSCAQEEALPPLVIAHIRAIDAFGVSHVVASLRMSRAEARDLGARLTLMSEQA